MIDAKNALLVAVVLAVVFVVGFYIPYVQYQKQGAVSPEVSVDGPVTRVTYTNNGFEPEVAHVEKGTTIEWLNDSDKLMWVASDDHPSHTDLPGFDQKGIVGSDEVSGLISVATAHAKGTIYRHTFVEQGTWEYHNHLVPADTGTVEVK